MVGQGVADPVEGTAEEASVPAPAKSKFPCRYCEQGQKNALTRFHHEKREHPDEVAAAAEEKDSQDHEKQLEKMSGGIPVESLTEVTKGFVEALSAAAPEMTAPRRRQLINAYDDNYPETAHDMEDFLGDWGLKPSQIRIMISSLFPKKYGGGSERGGANPGQTVFAMDPATGRTMPIIVLGGNGGNQSQPQAPMIIQAPPGETKPPMSAEEIAAVVEGILDKRELAQVKQAPVTPQVQIRRYQEPILGPDGLLVLDGKEEIAMRWVEEPVTGDADMDKMIDRLSKLGVLGQQPQTVSAEEIATKVAPLISHPAPAASPEIAELKEASQGLKEQLTEMTHQMQMKEEVGKAVDAATTAVLLSVQPQLDLLKEATNPDGLTDHQATLLHEQKLTGTIMTSLATSLGTIREDLRPMVVSQAAAALRQQGFTPQAIVDILAVPPGSDSSGAPKDEVAAAMDKWVTK